MQFAVVKCRYSTTKAEGVEPSVINSVHVCMRAAHACCILLSYIATKFLAVIIMSHSMVMCEHCVVVTHVLAILFVETGAHLSFSHQSSRPATLHFFNLHAHAVYGQLMHYHARR
jgi:hypothetical protein